MRYDVYGMCNALFDIQAEVTDEQLTEIGLPKGSMVLLDEEQQSRILPLVSGSIVNRESGGSGANTMIGVAQLGGTATYTSRVGPDEYGKLYRENLAAKGVVPHLGVGDGPTGVCLVLVTPDAQRTMGTFLGQSRELRPEDVHVEDIEQSLYLYITGYLWDTDNQKEAVLHAMRAAKRANTRVALSLSDPFCVNRHTDDFRRIVHDYVDVLFGNAEEAKALAGVDNALDAAKAITAMCDVVAVTLDRGGSLIGKSMRIVEIPVYPVDAVDTTGAGDMYAAGLLHGMTRQYSLEVSGRIASYAAAQVVAKLGPRLESLDPSRIEAIRRGEAW